MMCFICRLILQRTWQKRKRKRNHGIHGVDDNTHKAKKKMKREEEAGMLIKQQELQRKQGQKQRGVGAPRLVVVAADRTKSDPEP